MWSKIAGKRLHYSALFRFLAALEQTNNASERRRNRVAIVRCSSASRRFSVMNSNINFADTNSCERMTSLCFVSSRRQARHQPARRVGRALARNLINFLWSNFHSESTFLLVDIIKLLFVRRRSEQTRLFIVSPRLLAGEYRKWISLKW